MAILSSCPVRKRDLRWRASRRSDSEEAHSQLSARSKQNDPSLFQAPPRPVGASQSVCGGPPVLDPQVLHFPVCEKSK